MYNEEEFISINTLQHYIYCPRQCALIVVDDVWRNNLFTTRGNILHEKVDTPTAEVRGAIKSVRSLRIHSYRLGITGKCDVVEFYRRKTNVPQESPNIACGRQFSESLVPIEFKAGAPKSDLSDKVQLCAQALCLEEMLATTIPYGMLFYGKIRRRVSVKFDETLRSQTEATIKAVHQLSKSMYIPPAEYTSRCRNCSLYDVCQPKSMNSRKLTKYLDGLYEEAS